MGWATSSLLRKARRVGACFWFLLGQAALAGGPENWSSAYDARLSQAMGASPSDAIAIYEALVAQIPQNDDQRGDVLYWLGRARWSAGDLAGARRSLESARQYRSARPRVRTLLGRMDAEDKAVKKLPYRKDFRLSVDPWVRGWKRGKESDLKLFDGSDGYSARWSTEVLEGESDFIIFGISLDGASLNQVSIKLRSESLQGRYRILLEDDEGGTWAAPLQSVSTDRWADISLPISAFVRTDDSRQRSRVDGSRIKWVILRDVTALHTAQRGTNALLIDDLILR